MDFSQADWNFFAIKMCATTPLTSGVDVIKSPAAEVIPIVSGVSGYKRRPDKTKGPHDDRG